MNKRYTKIGENNIQMMHQDLLTLEQSCSPKQSRGEHHLQWLTNPDVNRKINQMLLYIRLSLVS